MPRATGKGGRFPKQNPEDDGGTSPAGFECDGDAWNAGLALLQDLRRLRSASLIRPDERNGDRLVLDYYRKIQSSSEGLALKRIVSQGLDGTRLTAVLYVLAACHSFLPANSLSDCLALICGFHPANALRLRRWITGGNRLMYPDYYWRLYPTARLWALATGPGPITLEEVRRFKRELKKWPVKKEPKRR